MSNSQLSPSNLERPTSNNGSQTPWSTHSAMVKREVTIPWSVYTHCGRSTFVTTAAVSDYTYMYLSEFKREQTPWGAMNWFCAELMQHQLLRFGCWSTGTHNSDQKSLRVEWATLEFVPKSFINSPSLRKEHKNQLMSEGRNFNVFGQFKLNGQWGR